MQFWAWALKAWKTGAWKSGSWGQKPQPAQQGGSSAGGGGEYLGTSMWDEPLPEEYKYYKLIRQEDREIFEILESLTLSGII